MLDVIYIEVLEIPLLKSYWQLVEGEGQGNISVYSSCRKSDIFSKERSQSVKLFVCVEVLRPSQPNGVMSSAVSLPNRTFTGQA